jgi:Tol biopolymer transport system component
VILKRPFIIAALAVLSLSALTRGDVVRVMDQPIQLTTPGSYFMQPIWSPLGDRLVLAGENYEGLWTILREGGEPQQISEMMGAGFLPVWDPGGARIACRVSRTENKRKLSAIAVYDLENGTSTELTEYQKELSLPQWVDQGHQLFFLKDRTATTVQAPGASGSNLPQGDTVIYLKDGRIMLYGWPENKVSVLELSPQGEDWIVSLTTLEEGKALEPAGKTILWAELSPNGGRIAFQALGAELYVVDVDGSNLISLGRGERPRWSPNSDWITYMITEDDGHRMLSADIYAIHRDGSGRTAITQTPDRLEMNPHWSPDGRMIACDTRGEGVILLIPVETERSYPPER